MHLTIIRLCELGKLVAQMFRRIENRHQVCIDVGVALGNVSNKIEYDFEEAPWIQLMRSAEKYFSLLSTLATMRSKLDALQSDIKNLTPVIRAYCMLN